MRSKTAHRAATLLIAAAVLAPTLAAAQTAATSQPPRSRYALPEPTRKPDIDDFINGNGKLHFSGQWRHWGDSRNNGELVQMLLAPETVQGHGRTPNGLPSSRFCYDNPDQC